jgi:chorismate synthase
MNTFGQRFAVSTFGESHGVALGCLIDGCPPGIAISEADFAEDLARRATGKTRHTSQRHEADAVEILSGVFEGQTTGTPIMLLIRNTDQRSQDYRTIAQQYRPGHADYTYDIKYGQRDYRGGGRSSARETAARVMAAVLAKKFLQQHFGTRIRACLTQIGPIKAAAMDWDFAQSTPLFWPDPAQLSELEAFLDGLRKAGDSCGGRVSVMAEPIPAGLGEPLYGKLDGDLAAALMGINAVKAVEIGDGVAVAEQRGSTHRDQMRTNADGTRVVFDANHAGGILGGISTGQALLAHVSIKPTSSIAVKGQSIDSFGNPIDIATLGRHDPCVAIRAPAIVEAMVALVLMDHVLRDRAQMGIARPAGSPLLANRHAK